MSLYSLVNRIATEDGQTFESVETARQHELALLSGKEDGKTRAEYVVFVLQNWPRILEIMTSEPGQAKPKARKRRSDFGTKRPPKVEAAT